MLAAKGVMNASAINNTVLPSSDIIKKYNLDMGSLFKLTCEATYVEAPTMMAVEGGIAFLPNVPKKPVRFEAICNAESFTMNHQHNFGDSDSTVGQIINMFQNSGIAKGALEVARAGAGAVKHTSDTGSVVGAEAPLATPWNTFSGVDVARAYQSTEPLSFELSMVLVADSDPLIDVVVPASYLTFLTYPSQSPVQNTDALFEGFKEVLAGLEKSPEDKEKEGDQGEDNPELLSLKGVLSEIINGGRDALRESGLAENVRLKVGTPPPIWKITSSNGIIQLDTANVRNLNITYHGPWISSPNARRQIERNSPIVNQYLGLSKDKIQGLNNDQITNIEEVIANQRSGNGYPSWAEVKMTFTNTFGIMFAEEAVQGMIQQDKTVGGAS
jgi:hypothetical protein